MRLGTGYQVSKEDLIFLSTLAEQLGYNRQLVTEAVAKLEVTHFLLTPMMLHEHVAGVSQPPENWQQRVMVHTVAETKAGKKPLAGAMIGFLDVQIGVWNEAVKDSKPITVG